MTDGIVDLSLFLQGAFFVVLFFFTIYTVLMVYHWFAYGTNRAAAMIALAIYLAVAAICFSVMAFFI